MTIIAEINLTNLKKNYEILSSMSDESVECAAVVKADAYGVGMKQVSQALFEANCRKFFVATPDEAFELRDFFDSSYEKSPKIYLLNGIVPGETKEILQKKITPVLNDLAQISFWQQNHPLEAYVIQIDTGMNRLGISMSEFRDLHLSNLKNLEFILSHLACADEPENAMNFEQLARVKEISEKSKLPISFANSSGIFLGKDFHFNIMRPGMAIYGLNPTPQKVNPMQRVVSFYGHILQISEREANSSIGYGASFRTTSKQLIATVSGGYADGIFRNIGNVGTCFIGGKEVKIIGRVSMDSLTIDLTNVAISNPELCINGQKIEFFGENQSIEEFAQMSQTIPYEILTSIGNRVKKVYKK